MPKAKTESQLGYIETVGENIMGRAVKGIVGLCWWSLPLARCHHLPTGYPLGPCGLTSGIKCWQVITAKTGLQRMSRIFKRLGVIGENAQRDFKLPPSDFKNDLGWAVSTRCLAARDLGWQLKKGLAIRGGMVATVGNQFLGYLVSTKRKKDLGGSRAKSFSLSKHLATKPSYNLRGANLLAKWFSIGVRWELVRPKSLYRLYKKDIRPLCEVLSSAKDLTPQPSFNVRAATFFSGSSASIRRPVVLPPLLGGKSGVGPVLAMSSSVLAKIPALLGGKGGWAGVLSVRDHKKRCQPVPHHTGPCQLVKLGAKGCHVKYWTNRHTPIRSHTPFRRWIAMRGTPLMPPVNLHVIFLHHHYVEFSILFRPTIFHLHHHQLRKSSLKFLSVYLRKIISKIFTHSKENHHGQA